MTVIRDLRRGLSPAMDAPQVHSGAGAGGKVDASTPDMNSGNPPPKPAKVGDGMARAMKS